MRRHVTYLWCLVLYAGCSSTGVTAPDTDVMTVEQVSYSIVYVIHGDAGYLYHTSDGRPLHADREVLVEARGIAQAAADGEVFIFHQLPVKRFLGIVPRRNRHFQHYRGGELIREMRYDAEPDGHIFLAESKLYRQYRGHPSEKHRRQFFLYFGHEVPDDDGRGYHNTDPDVAVNVRTFSAGMGGFLSEGRERFDLVVLSTCNNGSPLMVHMLEPWTDYVLASPHNLHLSFIDTRALSRLESDPTSTARQLGLEMAENTYKRLSETVHTELSIALYDIGKTRLYAAHLNSIARKNGVNSSDFFRENNIDCRELAASRGLDLEIGVRHWYRPARFGRSAGITDHSGWSCPGP